MRHAWPTRSHVQREREKERERERARAAHSTYHASPRSLVLDPWLLAHGRNGDMAEIYEWRDGKTPKHGGARIVGTQTGTSNSAYTATRLPYNSSSPSPHKWLTGAFLFPCAHLPGVHIY